MNCDFKELLSAFNEAKVRYLIVGGYAVMRYSEPRYTKDLDIWIDVSTRNSRAVFRALRTFGAPLANLSASDFAREGCTYQMGRPPVRVDIIMSIQGVRFPKAWRNRVATDFDGVAAHFLSLDDLITNKRALGRPQDLIDLKNLLDAKTSGERYKGVAPTEAEKSPGKRSPKRDSS